MDMLTFVTNDYFNEITRKQTEYLFKLYLRKITEEEAINRILENYIPQSNRMKEYDNKILKLDLEILDNTREAIDRVLLYLDDKRKNNVIIGTTKVNIAAAMIRNIKKYNVKRMFNNDNLEEIEVSKLYKLVTKETKGFKIFTDEDIDFEPAIEII